MTDANLVAELVPEFEKLKTRFPPGFEPSLVLPCLRRIQEKRGFVSDADIEALVSYLGVPRMRGTELLTALAALPSPPPVIVVSAARDAARIAAACGAKDCFVKPFDVRLLRERLRSLLAPSLDS